MSLKILHLENKATNEHKYYGSMLALLKDNPQLPFYAMRRVNVFPYERGEYIIREGERLSVSDIGTSDIGTSGGNKGEGEGVGRV